MADIIIFHFGPLFVLLDEWKDGHTSIFFKDKEF